MTRKSKQPAKGEKTDGDVRRLKRRATRERFSEAGQRRLIFAFVAESGTVLDDVLAPGFWLPVARDLRPWSRIEVMEAQVVGIVEDLSDGQAQVVLRLVAPIADGAGTVHFLAVADRGVFVELRNYTVLPGVGVSGGLPRRAEGTKIAFGGDHLRWCVYRGDDVLVSGHPTEAHARRWLEDWSATVNQTTGGAA